MIGIARKKVPLTAADVAATGEAAGLTREEAERAWGLDPGEAASIGRGIF